MVRSPFLALSFSKQLEVVSESRLFQLFTLTMILLAGAIVGLETSEDITAKHGETLLLLDSVILSYFFLEMLVRIGAHGLRPWRFFQDSWNGIDFLIVVICLIPFGGQHFAVFRLVRILRLLRVISFLPRLQVIVTALLHSLPAIGYVTLLLVLHFYIYGVVGTSLFGKNDPIHFGTLPIALISLFRVLTLEDWTDLMYIQMQGSDRYGYDIYPDVMTEPSAWPIGAVLYFVSFVLIGTMIILNLFMGVIMNGFTETKAKVELTTIQKKKQQGITTLAEEVTLLASQLDTLKLGLQAVYAKLDTYGTPEKVPAVDIGAKILQEHARSQFRVIEGGAQKKVFQEAKVS